MFKFAHPRRLLIAATISAIGLFSIAAPARATTAWTPTATCASGIVDIPYLSSHGTTVPRGLTGSAGSYSIPTIATGANISNAAAFCAGTPLDYYGGDASTNTSRTAYLQYPAAPAGMTYFDENNVFHVTITGTPGAFGWDFGVLNPATALFSGSPATTTFHWSIGGQPASGEYTLNITATGISQAARDQINAAGPIIEILGLGNYGASAHLTDLDQLKALTVNRYGHAVAFDANGGSGTMAGQAGTSSTVLTTNSFARAGYTFTGWNTAANGGGTAYTDGGNYDFNSADVTLYAQWTVDASSGSSGTSLASTGFNGTGPALIGSELVLLGALVMTLRKLVQVARARR